MLVDWSTERAKCVLGRGWGRSWSPAWPCSTYQVMCLRMEFSTLPSTGMPPAGLSCTLLSSGSCWRMSMALWSFSFCVSPGGRS